MRERLLQHTAQRFEAARQAHACIIPAADLRVTLGWRCVCATPEAADTWRTLIADEMRIALRIEPAEFDEVAAELGRALDFFKVPKREKDEVLAAFAAHKNEVTEGYRDAVAGFGVDRDNRPRA